MLDHSNLILDVETRWNSTYLMIERAIKMKEPLHLTIASIKELTNLTITDEEWNDLKSIMDLLKPFYDATNLVSTPKNPILSEITGYYQVLFDHLESAMDNSDELLKAAASRGFEKLKKYYPTCDGDAYIVATSKHRDMNYISFHTLTTFQNV